MLSYAYINLKCLVGLKWGCFLVGLKWGCVPSRPKRGCMPSMLQYVKETTVGYAYKNLKCYA